MRPVKLTMQAFGSYGNLTQIDFQEPDQNLFLVTGDTGAGKTTIFDAIVFALYGEASSSTNKKDGVVLQSQYVELNVEPFVELVFSEGAGENRRLYTVRRVPRHLKRLTRGAGKNTGSREVTGSVSLIMPDGTEYPQKVWNQHSWHQAFGKNRSINYTGYGAVRGNNDFSVGRIQSAAKVLPNLNGR